MGIILKIKTLFQNIKANSALKSYTTALKSWGKGKRSNAIKEMHQAYQKFVALGLMNRKAQAKILVSYWEFLELLKTKNNYDGVNNRIGSIIENIPGIDKVEDPLNPTRVINRSELLERIEKDIKEYLHNILSEHNYSVLTRIYENLAHLFKIKNDTENYYTLIINSNICSLLIDNPLDVKLKLCYAIREKLQTSKLVQTKPIEYLYGTGNTINGFNLLKEIEEFIIEIGYFRNKNIDLLIDNQDILKSILQEKSFIILDKLIISLQDYELREHLISPYDRQLYLSGIIESKMGEAKEKLSISEAIDHYAKAKEYFKQCNDEKLDKINMRIAELEQKATCYICGKEQEGLKVNFDIVKIEVTKPESLLFKDISTALANRRNSAIETDSFPVCYSCRGIVEKIVKDKSFELRDTVLSDIKNEGQKEIEKVNTEGTQLLELMKQEKEHMLDKVNGITEEIQENQIKLFSIINKIQDDIKNVTKILGIGSIGALGGGYIVKKKIDELGDRVEKLEESLRYNK